MRLKILLFLYFLCLPAILFAEDNFQVAIITPDKDGFFPSQELQLKANKVFFEEKDRPVSIKNSNPYFLEDNQITSLKEEIEILRKQLIALQQYVERREEKINFLTNQLIELSLRLSEKERSLGENVIRLTVLSQQLIDFQSRLELGQRIIQEKDRQISSLATGMTSPKEEQSRTENRDKEIQSLKNTIDHLRREALQADGHFKNYLSSQNKEFDELKGVLQIYKEKLRQANQLMKEKVSVLNELVILGDQIAASQNELLNPK